MPMRLARSPRPMVMEAICPKLAVGRKSLVNNDENPITSAAVAAIEAGPTAI